MNKRKVRLEINGIPYEGEAEPRRLLSDFIREDLGLHGTHVGCEHGVCGACTIQWDGKAVRSCLVLAVQANGARLRTVEGLAPNHSHLHPIQQAFTEVHALQCGFCTPGILMTMQAMLRANPRPSEAEVRDEPKWQFVPLHRLPKHREGSAARRRKARAGTRPVTMNYVGTSIKRKEDNRLLRGSARFVGDIKRPGMLHAAILRSSCAPWKAQRDRHRAGSQDARGGSRFLPLPIWETSSRFQCGWRRRDDLIRALQKPLAGDRVRYVGEPLAVVIAESRYQAEDALEVIEVEIDELEAVVDARRAVEKGRLFCIPPVPDNNAGHFVEKTGDVERALAERRHRP